MESNNNIVFDCNYHVVWCPKYRKKLLVGDLEKRLKQIVREVCLEKKATLKEIECDKDHIHILVGIDPQFGIHRLVKAIKGRSSFIIRRDFKEARSIPTLWTNSYFVSTVGGVTLEVVKKYIESQKTRYKSDKEKGYK